MSRGAPGQELPPALAGETVCAPRASAAHATAEVAPETWLDSVWAAAAGLLDDEGEGDEAPGRRDPLCSFYPALQDDAWSADQLSTQLYRNKQLQETLSQKEEELARMQEENRRLRQFLSSALVKQLEEKTKKLLLQSGRPAHAAFKSGKRRLKPESPLPPEAAHPQKARRNLLDTFSACEEPPGPAVDRWVLQTLGLKDVDTIDRSPTSANYSASAVGLEPGPFLETLDLGCCDALPAAFGCTPLPSLDSAGDAGREPLPCPPQPPALPHPAPLPPSGTPLPPGGSPRSADGVPPARMDVAFSTSLSPHCNVRTHSFRQGQAFVRREEDGGWKLTWVPRQPE